MALEEELRGFRARTGQAKTKQVRAQADYEGAQSRVETARKDLQDTYGVSTPEEAKAKLIELNEALQATKLDVEKKLQEAGV